jgi:lipoprotein NlpI
MAYFLLRQYKAATEDFSNTLKQNPENTYAKIWREVSLLKSGAVSGITTGATKTGEKNSAASEGNHQVNREWPTTILAFLLGEISEQSFIDTAYNPDPVLQNEQYCELWFYIGQRHLAIGNREQALSAFKKSIETGVSDFAEYLASKNEL